MASTSESAREAAHNRWHRNRKLVRLDCGFCQRDKNLPPNEVELGTTQPTVAREPFDTDRALSMLERERSLEECSAVFEMSQDEFKAQLKAAFNLDWDALSQTAPLKLFNAIERAIYQRARAGDPRFVMLLVKCRKLRGWNADEQVFSPYLQSDPRVLEMPTNLSTLDEIRQLSTEQLQARREALTKVIDRPYRFASNFKDEASGLELRDATPAETAEFLTKVNAPLFLPEDDADIKQSSPYMQINLD